jgi:tRNA(Ile)-lysidine synthase
MLKEFKKFISEKITLNPDGGILLAVSGGIDSMVMTSLFIDQGIKIGIAHCNFSLRGEESDKDEEFVQKYAVEHKIQFFTKRFDTKSFAEQSGLSIQMAARELRYNWFEEIRRENQFDFISIAHNLNDSTETFLINLIRGTGISGLGGIKSVQNKIIRPLLFASRQDIVQYSIEHKISFREDRSNAETKYTRNKIRHLVLPLLKEINPSVESTLTETSDRLSEVNEIVSEYINDIRGRISERKGQDTIYNIAYLKAYLHNRTILYELFKVYGLSGLLIKDLKNVITGRSGGKIFTTSHRIIKNRTNLIISTLSVDITIQLKFNNIEDFHNNSIIRTARYVNISPEFSIPSRSDAAYLDGEKIVFPLTIRKWQPGDYFYPLGMSSKKKLSDYFIDKKFSPSEKENALVIESEGEIAWIIGERIDERFKITESTTLVLILET